MRGESPRFLACFPFRNICAGSLDSDSACSRKEPLKKVRCHFAGALFFELLLIQKHREITTEIEVGNT